MHHCLVNHRPVTAPAASSNMDKIIDQIIYRSENLFIIFSWKHWIAQTDHEANKLLPVCVK